MLGPQSNLLDKSSFRFSVKLGRAGFAPPCQAATIVLLAFMTVPLHAQQAPASDLKVIKIEETDEVRAVRQGKANHPYASVTTRSAGPQPAANNRFLAAIDISKLDPTVIGGAQTRSALSATAADTLEQRTTYDADGTQATSFATRYEELNTTLSCHWAYDDEISSKISELEAKAREAELERSFKAPRGAAPSEEPAAPAHDNDPEFEFVLKERQLTKAGRPCLLTVLCEKADDARCSDKFLDELAKSVVLVREGAR